MSLSAVITIAAFLTESRPGRDALWIMDALCYSHVHHNLIDRLRLRIYEICRRELAELCLRCFALHFVHPSPISRRNVTRHIPPKAPIPNLVMLSTTALVAGVFIVGLIYNFGSESGLSRNAVS